MTSVKSNLIVQSNPIQYLSDLIYNLMEYIIWSTV